MSEISIDRAGLSLRLAVHYFWAAALVTPIAVRAPQKT